jgi:putative nucleotide binding protein
LTQVDRLHERETGLEPKRLYEEYAYVMDFLPTGRSSPDKSRYVAAPTAQVVGEDYFTMLEAELKPGAFVEPSERIYVGKDRREKVNRILGRISYQELTASAKAELPVVLEKMIQNQEKRFVDFFNNAQAVTPRMHALEVLPGVGKKSMWQIIDQRDRKLFESFADIQKRTSLSDPVKTIAKRIAEELTEDSKYRLFTRAI